MAGCSVITITVEVQVSANGAEHRIEVRGKTPEGTHRYNSSGWWPLDDIAADECELVSKLVASTEAAARMITEPEQLFG